MPSQSSSDSTIISLAQINVGRLGDVIRVTVTFWLGVTEVAASISSPLLSSEVSVISDVTSSCLGAAVCVAGASSLPSPQSSFPSSRCRGNLWVYCIVGISGFKTFQNRPNPNQLRGFRINISIGITKKQILNAPNNCCYVNQGTHFSNMLRYIVDCHKWKSPCTHTRHLCRHNRLFRRISSWSQSSGRWNM